jgi:integrase
MGKQFNFTKAALDALPLPDEGKRLVCHDTKTTGLQVRVSASGVKTFSLYRRIKGGSPERVTLGRYPEMSIEQARRKSAEINAAIEFGANPAEVKRVHKGELTFGDLFRHYLDRHAKTRKRTWEDDEQRYQQYLERPLGSKKLSAITRQGIALIHSDITRAGHPVVANRVLALISTIFGRTLEWGLVENNPARGIRRNPEKSRDRFLQSNELPRFFASLAEEPNPTVRDYFLLSLLTGARRSNVLAMRWADVNLDEGIWRIPETKNGTPQNVTLSPEALAILGSRRNSTERGATYVFPGHGKSGHLMEPHKGWLRIFDRDELTQLIERIEAEGHQFAEATNPLTDDLIPESIGAKLTRARRVAKQVGINIDDVRIQNLRIHDLRRTLGSWQAKTGASMAIIGKSLNHKSQQTTAIYARLDLDPVRQSVNTATAAMLNAAGIKMRPPQQPAE